MTLFISLILVILPVVISGLIGMYLDGNNIVNHRAFYWAIGVLGATIGWVLFIIYLILSMGLMAWQSHQLFLCLFLRQPFF